MKFEKTLTTKITIEQSDAIVNYAARMKTDVSGAVREWIDGLENDPEQILKEIEVHNYHITTLQKKLEDLKQKKKEMAQTEEEKKKELEKKVMDDMLNKEISEESNRIWRKIHKACPIERNQTDELVQAERDTILKIIKEEIEHCPKRLQVQVIKKLFSGINKYHSTRTMQVFDEVIQRDTIAYYEVILNNNEQKK